jgi:hypothetical protein
MGLLSRILFPRRRGNSDVAYKQAMGVSSDLINRMREYSNSNDAARAVMADIWAQHNNIPFMTSVYQTVEEMKVPRANGHLPPAKK